MNLSDGEKLILLMLSKLYEELDIEGGIDPKLVHAAIHTGNLWGLEEKYAGVFNKAEPDPLIVTDTVKILNMWNWIEKAYEKISPEDKDRVKTETQSSETDIRFPGFVSDEKEIAYLEVTHFQIDSLGKFKEFKGREENSGLSSMAAYHHMYAVFQSILTYPSTAVWK